MSQAQELNELLDFDVIDGSYDTDDEYQRIFLHFFRIESEEFDEEIVYEALNAILEKTREEPLWNSLYLKAAGQLLSEDIEVGLPVLLNYSYFGAFTTLLRHYSEQGTDESFVEEIQKMSEEFDKK